MSHITHGSIAIELYNMGLLSSSRAGASQGPLEMAFCGAPLKLAKVIIG
jgi:hypothetical protein